MPIVNREATVEEIRGRLHESPLAGLREMLPDRAILAACRECGHSFRWRLYDPVVTVLHYLGSSGDTLLIFPWNPGDATPIFRAGGAVW